MAGRGGRGKEVALQVEVETQEDWEETISKEGLTVVDVYQEWCGPCKAMVSNFKRMKNEIGDDLLHFAVAKADSIESLERYRGKSEPCFLFYASGALVAVVRGANSPLLTRMITDQLAQEHKVLEGASERKEIRDPKFPHADDRRSARAGSAAALEDSESSESEDEDEEDETHGEMRMGHERINLDLPVMVAPSGKVMLEKMVTVAILEPEIVASDKLDEIMEKLLSVGLDILEQTERQLTVDEAKEFFASRSEEENFDDICTYMSSGPCQILVLTKGDFGDGIVEEWQEIIGPVSITDAKEQAPNSLRALYGNPDNPVARGFHGSATIKDAKRELRFFFPDFIAPKVSLSHFRPLQQQRTVAIIRPDALAEHRDAILEKINEAEFEIIMQKEMQLEKEQAESFYSELAGEAYFEELVTRMSSGPILVLVLQKEDAVESWKALIGPKEVEVAQIEAPESLRAKFAISSTTVNQLHGTDSEERVASEIAFFFPLQHTVAVIKPDAYHSKEKLTLKIREAGFNVVAQKDMLLTRDLAENLYKNCKDKEYFAELIDFMTSGPTSFLILSRSAAVSGWKELIGPTDPEEAKDSAPKSLRAMFGTSVLSNAVHGASDADTAMEDLRMIFGEVEFDDEGNLKKRKRTKKVVEAEPCKEDDGRKSGTSEREEMSRENTADTAEDGETERVENQAEEESLEPTATVRELDDGTQETERGAENEQADDGLQEQGNDEDESHGQKVSNNDAEVNVEEHAAGEGQTTVERPNSELKSDERPASAKSNDRPHSVKSNDRPQSGKSNDRPHSVKSNDRPQSGKSKAGTRTPSAEKSSKVEEDRGAGSPERTDDSTGEHKTTVEETPTHENVGEQQRSGAEHETSAEESQPHQHQHAHDEHHEKSETPEETHHADKKHDD